jgi:acetylornithine deacetylase/succinyl-diaminopimelate desuccinylase-like protein
MHAFQAIDVPEERSRALDWNELGETAVELLRHYLRIDTANDPAALTAEARQARPWAGGGEADAAGWIAAQLRSEGIATRLLEAAPGRVNVVARLQGRRTGEAITLLSHSDVVPAKRGEWSYDPYGGEVHDGYIYGRGALDLKGLGIVHLLTMIALKRLHVPLERDVVLIIAADEEMGGRFGTEWLLAQCPELLDCRLVLGEGAYSVEGMLPGGRRLQAIAIGEKGYLEIELLAEGEAGHASVPSADNSPRRLVSALEHILSSPRPIQLSPVNRALLTSLAQTTRGLHGHLLRSPWLLRWLPNAFARSAIIDAMIRDTLVATVLQAGQKHNVVPAQARAILSIRLLPETDPQIMGASIRRIADGYGVGARELMYKPANISGFDTPAYREIERQIRHNDQTAVITPIVSPAASDCRFFRKHGVVSYGWIPFVIPAADLHRVHGTDERVSITELKSGLRSFAELVLALATMPSTNDRLSDAAEAAPRKQQCTA